MYDQPIYLKNFFSYYQTIQNRLALQHTFNFYVNLFYLKLLCTHSFTSLDQLIPPPSRELMNPVQFQMHYAS